MRHQSPLLFCRHQPTGDTNPLYYFIGTSLLETPIPIVENIHRNQPTSLSLFASSQCFLVASTFTKSTCFFCLHQVCQLLLHSLGLPVASSFIKSTSPKTCCFWILPKNKLAQHSMYPILQISIWNFYHVYLEMSHSSHPNLTIWNIIEKEL